MFVSNNDAVAFLVKRNLVKHQKVSKYYDHDCRSPLKDVMCISAFGLKFGLVISMDRENKRKITCRPSVWCEFYSIFISNR